MKAFTLGALAAVSALVTSPAVAQQGPNFAAVQIKTTDLGHRTWMLQGQGGNITVIAGDDAVILVDAEYAALHDKIKAAVAALSDKPIRYVIDTHIHPDHTDGNQAFWMDGAILVGQADMARSMARGGVDDLSGRKIPPAPQAAIPTLTYDKATTLSVKGRTVRLVHMAPSHTRGDTAVWIPDADVLATGDLVARGDRWPNIDVGDGGGIDGVISGLDVFLKQMGPHTRIVPGHGPVMTRADLIVYRDLLVEARAAVRKLKTLGLTENQAVAAKPLALLQARSNAAEHYSDDFVRLVYRSVR